MKRINIFRILFFVILTAVVLGGCSKAEEELPPNQQTNTKGNNQGTNQNGQTNNQNGNDDDINAVSHDRTQEQDPDNPNPDNPNPDEPKDTEILTAPLCFTAQQANSSVRLFGTLEHFNSLKIQYSTDGNTWLDYNENSKVITLASQGDKVYFRGTNPEGFNKQGRYVTFKAEGKIAASGNVMSLIDPTLQTTEIPNEYCFASLFEGCTALTAAPSLPAETLKANCYKQMFAKCSALEKAPKVRAKQYADYACFEMFQDCTALTEVPALEDATLAPHCYNAMFMGCTALQTAPVLKAKTLATACYSNMFKNCSSLDKITVYFTDWNNKEYTAYWVQGVAASGTFVCFAALKDERGNANIPQDWTFDNTLKEDESVVDNNDNNDNKDDEPIVVDNTNYLCFTAEEGGVVVKFTKSPSVQNMEYSFDKITWQDYRGSITLQNYGDKVYFRGDNPNGLAYEDPSGLSKTFATFNFSGKTAASGNVMSLVDKTCQSTTIPSNYCFASLFSRNENLVSAPELPATQLKENCYERMFNRCSALTVAPELPATNLERYCYSCMFEECTSLQQVPSIKANTMALGSCYQMFGECTALRSVPTLTATNLAEDCYIAMFEKCTSLTQVSDFITTNLEDGCYSSMFSGCSSLKKAPKLPSTKLNKSCYFNMFGNCTSLTEAPELPATTLMDACYEKMFTGCTSLEKAPELPAETLVDACYEKMFSGCNRLSYIKVGFKACDPSYGKTFEWVKDVASKGAFYGPADFCEESKGPSYVPVGWTIYKNGQQQQEIIDNNNYLCLTAEESGSTVKFSFTSLNVEYSTDKQSWQIYQSGQEITLNYGDKVYFRGNNPDGLHIFYDNGMSTAAFKMTGKIAASGNVMSMVDKTCKSKTIPAKKCFSGLFERCEALTKAPELPATTLTEYCYEEMFKGCTSLTEAPALPATTLAEGCYRVMFWQCSNLTKAPELKAMSLAENCYLQMFCACTSLKNAPELPATKLAKSCYQVMFKGCSSLVNPPALNAMNLAEDCYDGMFKECESLTKAPELPATNLVKGCYLSMFRSCTNLSYVKVGFSSFNGTTENTSGWLSGVSSTGSFYGPANFERENGVSYVPEGWTLYKGGKEDKPEEEVKKITLSYTLSDNSSEITQGDDYYVKFTADQYSSIQVFVDNKLLKIEDDTKSLKVYLPTDNKGKFTVTAFANNDKTNSNYIEFSYKVVEKEEEVVPDIVLSYSLSVKSGKVTQGESLTATITADQYCDIIVSIDEEPSTKNDVKSYKVTLPTSEAGTHFVTAYAENDKASAKTISFSYEVTKKQSNNDDDDDDDDDINWDDVNWDDDEDPDFPTGRPRGGKK